MKNLKVSDELYDELKNWVVDPFDDTPEVVIKRALVIAGKAKDRWSPLDTFGGEEQEDEQEEEPEYQQQPRRNPEPFPEKSIKVL